jgi:Icc protein
LKKFSIAITLAVGMMFAACEGVFQFNPNQVIFDDDERDLNQKNIERIKARPLTDTVKFILMGDSQRWYDETDAFIKSANSQKDIAFILHAGDISDFGLSQEFKWVHEIMKNLKAPYLTVIGNHDLVANGPAAYRKIYGPMDYSFDYGNNKFIFINTNSREYIFNGQVPNVNWLEAELANNPENKNAIVVAHIPPFDGDFDPNLQDRYAKLLSQNSNVKFTLYGHQHTFKDGEFYNDGVHYYLTTSMGERGYMLFTTWKGGYKAERITY